MSSSSTPLGAAQSGLLKKYSDLKLVCCGEEFDVHKVIVCTQSPVLAAACDGGFKEAISNTIHIEEFDPNTVKRMLQFLYTKEYDDGSKPDTTTDENSHDTPAPTEENHPGWTQRQPPANILLCNVLVNEIADYYDIPPLRELANTKIQRILEGGTASWYAEGFSHVILDLFRTPPADAALQNITISAVGEHIEELIEMEEFTRESELLSKFAMDLIRNITKRLQSLQSQLRDLESELEPLRESHESQRVSLEQESARADRIVENIEHCRKILSETLSCRNMYCDVQFRLCIDRHNWPSSEPKYFVYCMRCGHRRWG